MSFLANILQNIKDIFFYKRPLPEFNPKDEKDCSALLKLINIDRMTNGLLPLERLHELDVVSLDGARFNYQNNKVSSRIDGLDLPFRIMKQDYAVDLCAELHQKNAKNANECLFAWLVRPELMGVLRNGFFCHVGIAKCGNFWTAVFSKPKLF